MMVVMHSAPNVNKALFLELNKRLKNVIIVNVTPIYSANEVLLVINEQCKISPNLDFTKL
ncbi:hypothetical protein AFK76_12175 [Idiomarina zobellii]|uniref:Uncharacterized protein n=1 Tax=Idiomarina zobellii TaxID=86103 RepID=A0A837NCV5_9GAMM|nr:hypothetical protein AFK76_12175 [Idiomarina zobellii]